MRGAESFAAVNLFMPFVSDQGVDQDRGFCWRAFQRLRCGDVGEIIRHDSMFAGFRGWIIAEARSVLMVLC